MLTVLHILLFVNCVPGVVSVMHGCVQREARCSSLKSPRQNGDAHSPESESTKCDSPETSSTASDSPTPTNSVQEKGLSIIELLREFSKSPQNPAKNAISSISSEFQIAFRNLISLSTLSVSLESLWLLEWPTEPHQVLDPNQSAKSKAGSQPIRCVEFETSVTVGFSL